MPAVPIFVHHLPFYLRFTFASFLFALSRALMLIITSFGLIYIGSYFNQFSLWFITLPTALAYLYGISHFEGLEHELDLVHKRIAEDPV
jgi:MFS transporter, MHS family, proline/betaine transporter